MGLQPPVGSLDDLGWVDLGSHCCEHLVDEGVELLLGLDVLVSLVEPLEVPSLHLRPDGLLSVSLA